MPIWSDFSGLTDNDLTIAQLRAILRCKELADIKQYFMQRAHETHTWFEEKRWNEVVRALYTAKLNTNKINQSIFAIFNDGSVPYGAMSGGLSALGPITLAATSMLAIVATVTGVSALLTIALGAIYFVSAYRKQKKENLANIDEYALLGIKAACADLLISKYYQHKNVIRPFVAPEAFQYRNKNKLDKVKNSFGPAVMIGFMAFGTFYLGTTVIVTTLTASAAAAAFAGPIGIAVAFGVALIITGIMLYTFYRSSVNAEKVAQLKTHHTENLANTFEQINTLHSEYEQHLEQPVANAPPHQNLHAPVAEIVALPPQANFLQPIPAELLPPPAVINNLLPPPPQAHELPPPPIMPLPPLAPHQANVEAVEHKQHKRRHSAPFKIETGTPKNEASEQNTSHVFLALGIHPEKKPTASAECVSNVISHGLPLAPSILKDSTSKLDNSGENPSSNARTSQHHTAAIRVH